MNRLAIDIEFGKHDETHSPNESILQEREDLVMSSFLS